MSEKKSTLPGVLSEKEVAKIAKEELNEDPDRIKSDIKAIKEWIKKQPQLHKYCRTDDKHILAFLRGCKFSLERTKEKFDMYYSVRAACPEWFDKWDVRHPMTQHFLDIGLAVPLKGFDKHGRKVILYRMALMDPKKYGLTDELKFSMLVNDLVVERLDQSSVTGFIVVQDAAGISMGHLSTFNPAMGKKAMTIWQDCYPQRPKGVHFLNMPSIIDAIFNLMKSFAKEKMRQRMIVHTRGDLTGIQEVVGKEVLPAEYGGTNGVMQDHIDAFKAEFMEKEKFFMEQSKYKANEDKRQGMPRTHSDIFGVVGSFRQLNFD